MYGTALVQCCEYACAAHVVAACGPRVWSSRVLVQHSICKLASIQYVTPSQLRTHLTKAISLHNSCGYMQDTVLSTAQT